MKYTGLKLYDFQELNGDLQPKGKGRSSGMHVSGLVKAAYIEQFKKTPGPIEGEQPFVRSTMGFIWERALEFAFKEYMQAERKFVIKGRTVELDGVIGSLDGINVKDGCVEEYKCTWRSMRKWSDDPEAEFWMWLAQVKAYCHMTNHTRVRFFIFWVNGDYSYKTGRGPQVTTCEMEFTKEELEDNWRMLLAHMNIAKEEEHGEV